MTPKEFLEHAYATGYKAALDDRPLETCPYRLNTEARSWWMLGFIERAEYELDHGLINTDKPRFDSRA